MLLELFFPDTCVGCRRLLRAPTDVSLCRGCALEVVPSDDPERALLSYEGPPRAALHALKYGGDLSMAGPLGALLRSAPPLRDDPARRVVAVPLHPRRQRGRGFNQVAEIVRHALRGSSQRRLARDLVRRTQPTAPQVGLDPSARLQNVRDAFAVPSRQRRALKGEQILLVDDVRTTGATLTACAEALREAGADVRTLALMQAAG